MGTNLFVLRLFVSISLHTKTTFSRWSLEHYYIGNFHFNTPLWNCRPRDRCWGRDWSTVSQFRAKQDHCYFSPPPCDRPQHCLPHLVFLHRRGLQKGPWLFLRPPGSLLVAHNLADDLNHGESVGLDNDEESARDPDLILLCYRRLNRKAAVSLNTCTGMQEISDRTSFEDEIRVSLSWNAVAP